MPGTPWRSIAIATLTVALIIGGMALPRAQAGAQVGAGAQQYLSSMLVTPNDVSGFRQVSRGTQSDAIPLGALASFGATFTATGPAEPRIESLRVRLYLFNTASGAAGMLRQFRDDDIHCRIPPCSFRPTLTVNGADAVATNVWNSHFTALLPEVGVALAWTHGPLYVEVSAFTNPGPLNGAQVSALLDAAVRQAAITQDARAVAAGPFAPAPATAPPTTRTATPQPTATSTPPPTATATPPPVTTADPPADALRPPATTPPSLPPTNTALPSAPIDGAVLLADDFDKPSRGVLPSGSIGGGYSAYDAREYVIAKIDPDFPTVPSVRLPGQFDNAVIAVDARLTGAITDRHRVAIACRDTGPRRYLLSVFPVTGTVVLVRIDGPDPAFVVLGETTVPAVRRDAASNRIELACVGSLITVTINATRVLVAQDDQYSSGQLYLGVGAGLNEVEARFDNLRVVAQAPADDDTFVTLNENFDRPSASLFSDFTRDGYAARHDNGEFALSVAGGKPDIGWLRLPATFINGSISVDARLTNPDADQAIVAACRQSTRGGYQMAVFPTTGRVAIARVADGESVILLDERLPTITRGAASNRISFACFAQFIVVIVNGHGLVAIDHAHTTGTAWLSDQTAGAPATAYFDNLQIRVGSTRAVQP